MPVLTILRSVLLPAAFMAICCIPVHSQPTTEKGHYLSIRNFTTEDYHARPQNWDITEDKRGILYFGNSSGILVYDGLSWSKIHDYNGIIYSLEADRNGIVFAGGLEEIGYLNTNKTGQQEYVSLLPYLDESIQYFGEIWEIHATGEGVFFKANEYLFKWTGDTILTWRTENIFHTSFFVNRELYVREENRGLLVLHNDSLVLTEGGEKFSNIEITGMIPYKESGTLIFTVSDGIFHMISRAEGGSIKLIRHFNEIDNFMFENSITCALRLNFNQFAIGSQGKGAIVYDQSNDQYDFLNFNSGLQDEVIYNMHLDRRGNLWMALSNGISMSPVGTPVTSFGYSAGVKESVEGICRFRNRLFLSTIQGVYSLDDLQTTKGAPETADNHLYNRPEFRKIGNLEDDSYACMRFLHDNEELLLVATYYGISQVDSDFNAEQIMECYPWFIYQSKVNPQRVIIANEDGIVSMYRSEGRWITEPGLEDIVENCRVVEEDQRGNVWVGTAGSGKVFRIRYGEPGDETIPSYAEFDSTSNLPEGDIYLRMYMNEMIFGTSKGLYRFNEAENLFQPDTSFGTEFSNGNRSIHRISVDHEGYLWLVTYNNTSEEYETGYFIPSYNGTYTWVNEPFLSFSKGVIHSLFHDPDGVSWLGGPNGLFRYDRKIKKDYRLDYSSLIRKVSVKGDSLIFGGTFTNTEGLPTMHQNPGEVPEIKYRFNSIALEYAAPNNEDGSPVLFSHYLEGFEDRWHDWSAEYRREYTNLHEKTYTFHVKAINLYKHESAVTSYTFIIHPPWYRTIPMIIGFVLLGAGIFWLIVVLYTRKLKSIIRERTAEIREQKEEIEDKNLDIMDSITYARRIQSAMLTPGDYIDGLFPERFILYLPRDIVSGDYYWMIEKGGKIICVTADCTGHGVPGAMMSMMGMSYLNEITSVEHEMHSDEILNQLRSKIVNSLRQKGIEGESQDGMDMALYIVDMDQRTLEFSGAQLPLYLFRNQELQIIKPDKMPIGISSRLTTPFIRHDIKLETGDVLYTFSDGYQDQFGGPRNKKFMIKQFRQLLSDIHTKPMRQQKNLLLKKLNDWKLESSCEQVDDITVLGIKI